MPKCGHCNEPFWFGQYHHDAHDADTKAEHDRIINNANMRRRHYEMALEYDRGQRMAAIRRHAAQNGRWFQ